MRKRIEKWVQKLDNQFSWTIIFFVIISSILLYSIFTDFTSVNDFIYNAF